MLDQQTFLQPTEIIDWDHPDVWRCAQQLAAGQESIWAIAQACFVWVRDQIYHSVDYQMNPITCRASEVLKYRTGYCYAKSHLLAALLRANQIPTGFCYQRLSLNDQGPPYCLHGFNAIYLPTIGWYRVDARGNRTGVDAQFIPPQEQLAYQPQVVGEIDFPAILPEPLTIVTEALLTFNTWEEMLQNLPDVMTIESYGGALNQPDYRRDALTSS